MRFTHLVKIAAVAAAVSVVPGQLHAQWGVGAFVGREFDEADNWVIFGAHATYAVKNSPVVVNPRFTYHSYGSGSSSLQVDVNVLYDFALANPGLIRPYLGVGGGLVRLSESSDFCDADCSQSKLVANFLAGFKLAFGSGDSRLMPFVDTEYSFAKQFTNTYHLSIGFTYALTR